MIRQTGQLVKCADDLQDALLIECSKDEAKQYGTLKEWKKINKSASTLKKVINKANKKVNKIYGQSVSAYELKVLDVIIMLLPFFFRVMEILFAGGVAYLIYAIIK